MRNIINRIVNEVVGNAIDKAFAVTKDRFKLKNSNGVVVSECGFEVVNKDKWFNQKYVTLFDLKTKKEYRGKGFANELLNYIFKHVKNNEKVNIISLIVDKDNDKAIGLYKKCGFDVFIEYEDSYSMVKRLK